MKKLKCKNKSDMDYYESKSDNDIINIIQESVKNNIDSKFWSHYYEIISKRHSGIFFKMATKFISKKFKERRIDFFKDKDTYIFEIILDYRADKNTKFSTYLGNRIQWMCINNYHKQINCCEINCPDQLMYNCPDTKNQLDVQAICEIMSMLNEEKDKRVLKIFTFRYLEGKGNNVMPWNDVCSQEGINLSVQGCINLHNKYINKIREERK